MIIEIDSTTRAQKQVTLKEGPKVVASKITRGSILMTLRDLLVEQNIKLEQIEKVITISEGDSMTGLRVGAALANALNFASGKLKNLEELQFPKYKSPPKITLKKLNHS